MSFRHCSMLMSAPSADSNTPTILGLKDGFASAGIAGADGPERASAVVVAGLVVHGEAFSYPYRFSDMAWAEAIQSVGLQSHSSSSPSDRETKPRSKRVKPTAIWTASIMTRARGGEYDSSCQSVKRHLVVGSIPIEVIRRYRSLGGLSVYDIFTALKVHHTVQMPT